MYIPFTFYKQIIDAVRTVLGDNSVHTFLTRSFSRLFNFPLNSFTVVHPTSVLYPINRRLDSSDLILPQTIVQ